MGEFKDDERHGNGRLTYANTAVYQGDWVMGKATGKAEEGYPDGDFYRGEFKDGKRHGQGTLFLVEGGEKTGTWVDGDLQE